MARVLVGLGANLGPRRANLRTAWQRLAALPGTRCQALSAPYESAPLGMTSRHWFVNAVGQLSTSLEPKKVLGALLAIEIELGRNRNLGRDRPLDLDLLAYDGLVLNEPDLMLPHPELPRRLFVLAPLLELAPDWEHPLLGKTITELYQELAGSGQQIRRLTWPPS